MSRAGGDLVAVACDGETFGHHHPYADRGVAYALRSRPTAGACACPASPTGWPSTHPAAGRVRLSAWSCTHGVGRWLEDCGCHTGGEPGWNQAWRGPLRAALDQVRDRAIAVFERRAPAVLRDPWGARDAYIDVLVGATTVERFAEEHLVDGAVDDEAALVEALTLLESQRMALLMYTSCAWFFNDLAGIETVQILRYAACCSTCSRHWASPATAEARSSPRWGVPSNDPDEGDGRAVWRRHVEASRVDPGRIAAHLAMTELLAGHRRPAEAGRLDGYDVARDLHDAVDRAGGGVRRAGGADAPSHPPHHRLGLRGPAPRRPRGVRRRRPAREGDPHADAATPPWSRPLAGVTA